MKHHLAYYNDNAHVSIAFCRVCGKEGLQLITEPACSGNVDDLTTKKPESKDGISKPELK